MDKEKYNAEHKKVIDSFLLKAPGVIPGKMFGYPAYYVNNKLFACLYDDGVGVKVPEKLANELIGREGIDHFVPLGRRKMKEWVQITRKRSMDYLEDEPVFKESLRYVSSLGKKEK